MSSFSVQPNLLSHQHFPRCGEITCCEGMEINTTRNSLTDLIFPIPIRRTASALIYTCRLMSERTRNEDKVLNVDDFITVGNCKPSLPLIISKIES